MEGRATDVRCLKNSHREVRVNTTGLLLQRMYQLCGQPMPHELRAWSQLNVRFQEGGDPGDESEVRLLLSHQSRAISGAQPRRVIQANLQVQEIPDTHRCVYIYALTSLLIIHTMPESSMITGSRLPPIATR